MLYRCADCGCTEIKGLGIIHINSGDLIEYQDHLGFWCEICGDIEHLESTDDHCECCPDGKPTDTEKPSRVPKKI